MKFKFILSLFAFLSIISYGLQAQVTCPRGLVNCEGQCGRFVDENGNGICDPSEFKPVEVPATNEVKKKEPKKKVESKSPEKIIEDTSFESKITIRNQDTFVEAEVVEVVVKADNEKPKADDTKENNFEKPYRLIGISAITLALYLISMLFVRLKIWRKITHRKIWNTLLLITFLMSCLLGLVLVIQLNYNVFQSIYLSNLKLHVEFGIAMTLISIIHILWHLPYFRKLFCSKKAE